MKRSATSSTGLPLLPSQCRQRDEGGQKARGNARSPIFALLPSARFRGTAPKRTPIPTRQPRARDPQEEGGGGEHPLGQQTHLPPGSCRRPPGPSLPGSNRLSIQLPVARSPGESEAYTARPEPRPRFRHLPHTGRGARGQPSPAGREGGGAKTTLQGQPRGRGVREPGSRQQVSRGRPPANPCHTSCAFKFMPGPLSLQSPLHS